MKNIKWLYLLLLLAITGCSTTKITSSWKAGNKTPGQYNKILVPGLVNGPDHQAKSYRFKG